MDDPRACYIECDTADTADKPNAAEPHAGSHDVSLPFLDPSSLPEDTPLNFESLLEKFAVDLGPQNQQYINADAGVPQPFDGPTNSTSFTRNESHEFGLAFDQCIYDELPHSDGEPQQQFSTTAPRSAGDCRTGPLGAHPFTAPNSGCLTREADLFTYADLPQQTANLEFGWGVDNDSLMSRIGIQDVEATSGFAQTSGAEASEPTEQRNTEHAPDQSSESNVGLVTTQYQYQTIPIPATKTTARPKHDCYMPGCAFPSNSGYQLNRHIREAHVELLTCHQCQQRFSGMNALGYHAVYTGHASFACVMEDCEKTLSRCDVMERHLRTHRPDIQRFPCPHCRRHRGAGGFKRKDHLTQHLRNYRHIGVDEIMTSQARGKSCWHEDCPDWRPTRPMSKERTGVTDGREHAYKKSSEYTAHMRKVHKESEFPCTEPDCDRVGPKGYFRMRDLKKHKLKEHGIPIE